MKTRNKHEVVVSENGRYWRTMARLEPRPTKHRGRARLQPGRGGAGAFTLIEIMMVVAIIGLTLTMGFPAFREAWQREGIGKVERDLVKACQEARRAAIMNNQTTDLVIRPVDHTFSVPGSGFETATIPNEVSITALGVNFISMETQEEAHVHFSPKGTCDEFIIILHGEGAQYRTIYLDVVTALVRAEDGAYNPYKK